MILTFWGHVTSPVTWPFHLQYMVSYRCSVRTNPVSRTVVETLSHKDFWLKIWTLPSLHTHTCLSPRSHWSRQRALTRLESKFACSCQLSVSGLDRNNAWYPWQKKKRRKGSLFGPFCGAPGTVSPKIAWLQFLAPHFSASSRPYPMIHPVSEEPGDVCENVFPEQLQYRRAAYRLSSQQKVKFHWVSLGLRS